jgi:hypothetical protein
LDATRPSLKVYRMRHKVVTAYRCAQAMSKLIQENRSGRKVRGVLAHPGAKDLQPDRVDQRLGVWAGEGDAAFAQRPSHDLGVAVGRPLHLTPAVVDVEPRPAQTVQRAQLVLVGIGAFQVMGPVPRPGRDLVMQRPKSRLLVWGDRAPDRNQEVAVTMHVSVADSEGTLQVRADEVVAEDPGGARRAIAGSGLRLGSGRPAQGRRACGPRSLLPGSKSHAWMINW